MIVRISVTFTGLVVEGTSNESNITFSNVLFGKMYERFYHHFIIIAERLNTENHNQRDKDKFQWHPEKVTKRIKKEAHRITHLIRQNKLKLIGERPSVNSIHEFIEHWNNFLSNILDILTVCRMTDPNPPPSYFDQYGSQIYRTTS